MLQEFIDTLTRVWSTTRFAATDVSTYARYLMLEETRRGLAAMSAVALLLLCAQTVLYAGLGFGYAYLYTSVLLAGLAAHVFLSSRVVKDIAALNLLGMSLIVVSGTAFVLLAHKTGTFSLALFASVALLFMIIPMVPWGLREAFMVTVLVYVLFTFSTWGKAGNFEREALWTLQLVMTGAGVISMALVARNASVRKSDIQTRFELENAHKHMLLLSNKDPLTGAWNRRYLTNNFAETTAQWRDANRTFHFAILDVDDFKPLNDGYGHEYGDKVLQWLTQAFEKILAEYGYLVRMGGDEFAVLFAHDEPEALIKAGMDALQERANSRTRFTPPALRMSVGLVSVAPELDASQETIYRQADEALYAAKSRKRSVSGPVNLVVHRLGKEDAGLRSA